MTNPLKRPGFKNIQIQSKFELAELFEDTFQQSGCNSKAEFLGNLLDDYLNPDSAISNKASEVERENNVLSQRLHATMESYDEMKIEISTLTKRIQHYENEILRELFSKHRGQKLKFRSTTGNILLIEINDIRDVYTAVINSIKYKS